ncbi:Ff.00g093920.m01.CDS01 [Fusarium sp. VM40]|nr:Ff.00g093920.m01.CDS01 [Fusarium sp. VM40]
MVRHALQVTCEHWTSYSAAQAESSREHAQDFWRRETGADDALACGALLESYGVLSRYSSPKFPNPTKPKPKPRHRHLKNPFLKTTPAPDTGSDIDPHNNNKRLHSKAKRIVKKAEATRAPE